MMLKTAPAVVPPGSAPTEPGKNNNDGGGPAKSVKPVGLRQILIVATFALVGLLVLLYPFTARWFSAVSELNRVHSYAQSLGEYTPYQLQEQLARAEAYNRTLRSGLIVDPFSNTSPQGDALSNLDDQAHQYLSELDLGTSGVMSQVSIPSIDATLPVFHGATEETLRQGVGHLYGSSLPVGGPGTHAVLTAHSGLPEATLFDNLTKVKKGDLFYVSTYGRDMTYRVTNIRTVLPTDVVSLKPVDGQDLATLVTCTPVPINSHRLLVTGERVADSPGAAPQAQAKAHYPFPWAPFGALVCVLAYAGALVVSIRKAARARAASATSQE